MTDRLVGCTVVFSRDFREDDAASLLDAIRQLRGVGEVMPVVSTALDALARARVRSELRNATIDAVVAVFEREPV